MPKKIIITEDLKEILIKVKSDISTILLQDDVDENILKDRGVNYLDISHSQKGHISYLTSDRISKIEEGDKNYWEKKIRFHARPGSVMKKMFNRFGDWEIEQFATQFLSIIDPPVYRMEVVKGEDIAKYYHYSTYFSNAGSLGMSCMKGSPKEFFDIYVQNPDQINMLIMFDQNDKVMGRAILWPTLKVMDRIYVTNDTYTNYFYNWAKENDHYYKQYNNWATPKHMMFNGIPEFREFEISLDNTKFEKYPYLDSFKWLDVDNKKLYNYMPKDKTLITISDHMGNHFRQDHFGFCDLTNYLYNSFELVYLYYCEMNINRGNIVESESLGTRICIDHAKDIMIYKDDKHEITDYIFNEKYENLNDHEKIEKYKKDIEEKVKSGEYDKEKRIYGLPKYDYVVEEVPVHVPTTEELIEYEAWLEQERAREIQNEVDFV